MALYKLSYKGDILRLMVSNDPHLLSRSIFDKVVAFRQLVVNAALEIEENPSQERELA